MKLTMKMEEESLLLLLELADKYIDKGSVKAVPQNENDNAVKPEEDLRTDSESLTKPLSKNSGEDADFLLNVLAGEHFYTPDLNKIEKMEIEEEKKNGALKKDEIELVTEPPHFSKEEIEKLESAKMVIHKSKSEKMENEDCDMLLQIMDIYMDIYKP